MSNRYICLDNNGTRLDSTDLGLYVWTGFGFGCLGTKKTDGKGPRTDDIFPRRLLPRDIHLRPTRTRLEKLELLVRMQHCFFHVELLQGGVAVFDEPVGGVPGGEGGAGGAAAVACRGEVCC